MIRENDGRLLLTAREAAAALAVSERKLWDLTQNGGMPHTRIGRSVRYRLTDLAKWVDRHTSAIEAEEAPEPDDSSGIREPEAEAVDQAD